MSQRSLFIGRYFTQDKKLSSFVSFQSCFLTSVKVGNVLLVEDVTAKS